ncbi:hypothetical protein LX36DRAFT_105457 [Colletotrichum falcatum]|nr:hypothetical protein LX36DRAFT_105457 [Colletotrichum falcatum]
MQGLPARPRKMICDVQLGQTPSFMRGEGASRSITYYTTVRSFASYAQEPISYISCYLYGYLPSQAVPVGDWLLRRPSHRADVVTESVFADGCYRESTLIRLIYPNHTGRSQGPGPGPAHQVNYVQHPQNSLPLCARELWFSRQGLPPFSFCFCPTRDRPNQMMPYSIVVIGIKYEECNPRSGSTKPRCPLLFHTLLEELSTTEPEAGLLETGGSLHR